MCLVVRKRVSSSSSFTHLPPETVDTVKFVSWYGSIMDGCVSTIAFHAQAALIAAGMPPPEKAIPIDMIVLFDKERIRVCYDFT